MEARYRYYSFKLSHYRRETNYLKNIVTLTTIGCDVCHEVIAKNTTYWYADIGKPTGTPLAICYRCKYQFDPVGSLNRPYWITKPTLGACSNIRTPDDAGQREYFDGTVDEWESIWAEDMAGTRFP